MYSDNRSEHETSVVQLIAARERASYTNNTLYKANFKLKISIFGQDIALVSVLKIQSQNFLNALCISINDLSVATNKKLPAINRYIK